MCLSADYAFTNTSIAKLYLETPPTRSHRKKHNANHRPLQSLQLCYCNQKTTVCLANCTEQQNLSDFETAFEGLHMAVTKQQHYDISVDDLFNLLTDESFLSARYEAGGARNISINECAQDGDVFRIRWTREVPADPPGFAKKFLSEWNEMDETVEWHSQGDAKHSTYTGSPAGAVPIEITSTGDIRPDGDGCVYDITVNVNVKIPLVGKKIAQLVETDIAKSLDTEYEFTKNYK